MIHTILFAATEVVETAAGEHKQSVIDLLGIDWRLFIAQLVNFGIIVFVLWKWVFTPLTDALQKRTEKIEKSLQDAQDLKKKIEIFDAGRQEQEARAQAEFSRVVEQATRAGIEAKSQILAEARTQAEKIALDAEKRIRGEQEKMIQEVKEELATLVIAATEKVLVEKLDKPRDQKLVEASLKSVARR